MLATRGGSRTPRLYHDSDRSVGWADQCSLLNPRFGPAMATRGGWTSTLSTITRGVWHHVHTLDDHPRGWHTNRGSWRAILVSHLAILCRDPKRLRAVLELRHVEVELSFEQRPRGCGPSSSYDTLLSPPRFVPRLTPVFLPHGY